MDVQPDAVHTAYLFGAAAIALSMVLQVDVVVPISVIIGSLVAAKELFSIF